MSTPDVIIRLNPEKREALERKKQEYAQRVSAVRDRANDAVRRLLDGEHDLIRSLSDRDALADRLLGENNDSHLREVLHKFPEEELRIGIQDMAIGVLRDQEQRSAKDALYKHLMISLLLKQGYVNVKSFWQRLKDFEGDAFDPEVAGNAFMVIRAYNADDIGSVRNGTGLK